MRVKLIGAAFGEGGGATYSGTPGIPSSPYPSSAPGGGSGAPGAPGSGLVVHTFSHVLPSIVSEMAVKGFPALGSTAIGSPLANASASFLASSAGSGAGGDYYSFPLVNLAFTSSAVKTTS